MLQKPKLSTLELVFVLIAASTLFAVTFYQMSTSGILPGNDPAVHLVKSEKIVTDHRVTYSAVPWYPPLFHTIVAMLQIFAGTIDVLAAAFLIKLLISTLNVLMLLSIYLLCRKLFGIGVAVTASVFTFMSIPMFEMIFWGGYANFLGLAYIAFIFYLITKDMNDITKMFLLFVGAFTIVMSHQLATFIFVLLFVPIFIMNTLSRSKRRVLVYLGVIIGGGIALLAWYARIIIEYSNMIIEHLFFSMTENIYTISGVEPERLISNSFGVSLILAFFAIPVTVILLKKKHNLKATILIFSWLAIPFILSQSYLFGLYLPYTRFVYFFATPIAILAGIFTYSLTKISAIVDKKIGSKIKNRQTIIKITKILVIVTIVALFTSQGALFLERIETFSNFYERATISSYDTGIWIEQHAPPNGTIVTARSPGSWFNIFSDHHTIEETNPLYSRNAIAETVLYSFYEMENSRTLVREYSQVSPSAGQEYYISLYNIWKKTMSVPDDEASLIYVDPHGIWISTKLNETEKTVYWNIKSDEEAQLVTQYNDELFNATKIATFRSNSSVINTKWIIETHKNLANVKLAFTNNMAPNFNFQEALAPGILEWQNPWDNATYVNENGHWVVIETSADNLQGNTIAYFAQQNQTLAVFDFEDKPDWIIFGALENRAIDILRVRYELGYIYAGDEQEVSYSTLLCTSDFEDIKQLSADELIRQYDSKTTLEIQAIDYVTYIEEYDIKFVVVDITKILTETTPTPDLDKIYDNGRTVVYTTKR